MRFSASGELIDSAPLERQGALWARASIDDVSYTDPNRIRSTSGQIFATFFPRRVDRTTDVLSGVLRRTSPTLVPGRGIVRFHEHVALGPSSLREWSEAPAWDLCGERLVFWSPSSEAVLWLDLNGEPVRSVPLDQAPSALTTDDLEAYLRWMARIELGASATPRGPDIARLARSVRDRFAVARPRVMDLRCEDHRAVWIQQFDTSHDPLGRGRIWRRISIDGSTRTVQFPTGFQPFVFSQRAAYGVLETPEGHQTIGWWSRGSKTFPSPIRVSSTEAR